MSETTEKSPNSDDPKGASTGCEAAFKEGDLLAKHYRLGRALSRGGMGLAFLASDLREKQSQGSDWVLKILPQGLLAGDFTLHKERFLHSATLQARLSIPGVAGVRDYGELEDGSPYLVMPYDSGRGSFRELLDRLEGKVMPWPEAVEILRSTCQTLEQLHHARVIHRDIKPSNLLVHKGARGWSSQLIDFGIVKDLNSSESLTRTGASPGFSLQYGAPELHRSSGDPRSDIFSLGITILEAISGQCLPAKGPNDFDGVKVPGALHKIIRSMTDTDPEARPPSALAVLQALEKLHSKTLLSILAAVLTVVLVVTAIALGKKELDKNNNRISDLHQTIANLKAENRGLVATTEKLEFALKSKDKKVLRPIKVQPSAPNPLLKSLQRYNKLENLDRDFRGKALNGQTMESRRDAWADLEQLARPGAVKDAAHSWKYLYDSVLLRRRYKVQLKRMIKPFDPGANPLYLDMSHGETNIRLESLKAERTDGIATIEFPEDSLFLDVDVAYGVPLKLVLYESRNWAVDRALFAEELFVALPVHWKLLTDGREIEVSGKDGLRLTFVIRRL
jgi:serine/threonine protein kinase